MFDIVQEADEQYLYVVKVSFLEIYNEKIHDLLDSNRIRIFIRLKNQFANQRRSSQRPFRIRPLGSNRLQSHRNESIDADRINQQDNSRNQNE
jgi:kinesin family protein 5